MGSPGGRLGHLHMAVGTPQRVPAQRAGVGHQPGRSDAPFPLRGRLALLLPQIHWAQLPRWHQTCPGACLPPALPQPRASYWSHTYLQFPASCVQTTFSRLTCHLAPAKLRREGGGWAGEARVLLLCPVAALDGTSSGGFV